MPIILIQQARLFMRERAKTARLNMKSSTYSSGGTYTVTRGVSVELAVGAVSLLLAALEVPMQLYRVAIADSVVAGLAGTFGAMAFLNHVGLYKDLQKILSVLVGAGLGSIFGPLVANYLAFKFEWLRDTGLFLDSGSGCLIGLLATPLLGLLRDPVPVLTFVIRWLPWPWGKKDS